MSVPLAGAGVVVSLWFSLGAILWCPPLGLLYASFVHKGGCSPGFSALCLARLFSCGCRLAWCRRRGLGLCMIRSVL